jgi:post-segregation antitoxin (ccd killing protein)
MVNKAKKILTEISAGELLDKISILEIKIDNIKDKESLIEINKEYESLNKTKDSNIKITNDLQKLIDELKETNKKLWKIEDQKRICEKNKDFGNSFVELARNVYFNNDKRAKIKSEINKLLGSNIREIKKYVSY